MHRLSYLALGDSYTIGEGVPAAERWPEQMAALLRARGTPIVVADTLATTGWTTDELATAMAGASFAPPYDLVSLLIGVNNQYRGRPLDEYRDQFQALLDRAIELAGSHAGRVLVLSIPDWGTTPFAARSGRDVARIAADIDQFNATARACVEAAGAIWVDITPISRRHAELLVADDLHPSAAQYAMWADAAMHACARGLSQPS